MPSSTLTHPERFRVVRPVESVAPPFPFMVMDGNDLVDVFRTRLSAEHHARALNTGRAIVEPHRPVGIRIQPRSAR